MPASGQGEDSTLADSRRERFWVFTCFGVVLVIILGALALFYTLFDVSLITNMHCFVFRTYFALNQFFVKFHAHVKNKICSIVNPS